MGGLLGFVVTSAVLAIVGTAIRGLMRPLTLGLLALSLSLLAANRLGLSPNLDPPAPGNIVGQSPPRAIEGLQDAAENLEPVIEQAFPPEPTPTPSPVEPDEETTQEPIAPRQVAPSPSLSPSPIQGFW